MKINLELILILLSLAFFVNSEIICQEKGILRSNGELTKLNSNTEFRSANLNSNRENGYGSMVQNKFHKKLTLKNVDDTLSYFDHNPQSYIASIGFNSQDVMMTWFEAPADLTIKAIGLRAVLGDIAGDKISIKLVKLNWSKVQLNSFTQGKYLGYYPSAGDGFNNIGAFPNEATGEWIDETNGEYPVPLFAIEDFDLWSDLGSGFELIPEGISKDDHSYQWLETSIIENEPSVIKGDIFAVVVKHEGVNLDENRIGLWSMDAEETANRSFKYYENGRYAGDYQGWWATEYTFDLAVAIEIQSDRGPLISEVTNLKTVFSEEPRKVSAKIIDDNHDGGISGVEKALLVYNVNNGDSQILEMIKEQNDTYSTEIPGQYLGDKIEYYIEAIDVNGNKSKTKEYLYELFRPSGKRSLIVVNGYSIRSRMMLFLEAIYFSDIDNHDLWYFGDVTEELLNNYLSVFEIQMNEGSPYMDNREAYSKWTSNTSGNLLICGQDALGYLHNNQNQTFKPGDFEYDVLGIQKSYNNVAGESEFDELQPTVLHAQAGSFFGDDIFSVIQTMSPNTLVYKPYGLLGDLNVRNRLDQFEPRIDIDNEVFMTAESKDGIERAVGFSFGSSPVSDMVTIMTFDPSALFQGGNSGSWVAIDQSNPIYLVEFWYNWADIFEPIVNILSPNGGENLTAGQQHKIQWNVGEWNGGEVKIELFKEPNKPGEVIALNASGGSYLWTVPNITSSQCKIKVTSTFLSSSNDISSEFFTITSTTEVNDQNLPKEYALFQNYPNPFNPTTNIKYSVPSNAYVSLKVYDILGREVATLVNEQKPAGNYEVNFNASSLSSGVYFYKIQSGSFAQVRKMLLLK